MSQLSRAEMLELEIKRGKQFLVILLFLALVTSNLPNFLPVIWLDSSVVAVILKQAVSYIFLPLLLIFLSDDIFTPTNKLTKSILLPKSVSNIGIGAILVFSLIFFGLHTAFEINKNQCLITYKDIENVQNCTKEYELNRFKPFF